MEPDGIDTTSLYVVQCSTEGGDDDANARYDKKAYARVLLRVRNDSELNLDAIRAHIAETGESLNGFIMRAIAETIDRDKQQDAKEPAE